MIEKLWNQYREIILYGIFGVLTTVVNIVSYFICAHMLGIHYLISTVVSWVLSVLFAFVTNRIYVFESKNANILKELYLFFSFRFLSGIIDFLIMFLFVDVMHMNDMIIKILSNIIVIILNYVFSKLFIFQKKEEK